MYQSWVNSILAYFMNNYLHSWYDIYIYIYIYIVIVIVILYKKWENATQKNRPNTFDSQPEQVQDHKKQ
jgi:hypothetical protein